ncbi:hypothetical protein N657DRAFT_583768, partial [Parathielavia appendiculata]
PRDELDPRARVEKLMRNEFPSVSEDTVFGDAMMQCWHGEYASIASVQQDVFSRLGRSVAEDEALMQAAMERMAAQYSLLRAECEEYMTKQARERSY